jgi:iron complex transport system permease protein
MSTAEAAVLRHLTPRRFASVSALLVVAALATVVCTALIGPEPIHLRSALEGVGVDHVILFQIRLPRILLGMVVGGALGASGAALQALLRNPLAEPHIIGVSGGAALGGVLTLLLVGRTPVTELSLQPLGAFAGALLATMLLVRLGTLHGRLRLPTRCFCRSGVQRGGEGADHSSTRSPTSIRRTASSSG